MGVHPMDERHSWKNPWAGIEALVKDIPNHPYARLASRDIRAALDEILSFLEGEGLPYCRRSERNSGVITSLGTIKNSYCVPETMWHGVRVSEERRPCLIIDFPGLKDFSALRIVATQKDRWPDMKAVRVPFPGIDGEQELLLGEFTAKILEVPEARNRLARAVKSHLHGMSAVGMPPICGMHEAAAVVSDLGKRIGVPVFEIPTIPPSVPGQRLKETLESGLVAKGIRMFPNKRVDQIDRIDQGDYHYLLSVGSGITEKKIKAKGIILATGRFIGGGLHAHRKGIRETLFDFPVVQPESRSEWHREDLFDLRGHPIHRAGLETDAFFRPLNSSGRPAFDRVFASGSILAHQDWMRMKCGSGVAIATSYAAVNAYLELSSKPAWTGLGAIGQKLGT